jgi:hypothetical protein
MKVKDEKETCGPMTSEHKYLKEHRGFVDRGHQSIPISEEVSKVMRTLKKKKGQEYA